VASSGQRSVESKCNQHPAFSMRTARCAVVVTILCASLAGCSAVLAVQEPGRLFHPYVAEVSPLVRVIDSRPAASRTSRQVHRGGGVSAWVYGDEQFSPGPVQVAADRFAKMFPAAGPETVLVIAELEIYYELATFGEISPHCTPGPGPGFVMLPLCFLWEPTYDALRNRRNIVNARLSGRFNSVPFDVGYIAQFRDNLSDQQEKRVLNALQAVIDKALTEVAQRLNVGRIGVPATDHRAKPELP